MGNAVAAGIDKARTVVGRATAKFMPDVCDLIAPGMVEQGAGHTLEDTVLAIDIPCQHKQLGGGGITFHDGDSEVTKTHKIELPYRAETILIDRRYKIRVHANGFNREVIFEQTVIQTDSKSPFVVVFAVLTEGFRQPGQV